MLPYGTMMVPLWYHMSYGTMYQIQALNPYGHQVVPYGGMCGEPKSSWKTYKLWTQ